MAWATRLLESVARNSGAGLRGRRTLILAPHPDDEALACGGVIAQKLRAGADVAIAFLTDGRLGSPGSAKSVAAMRTAEAHQAASALGLPPGRLHFLGFEDGRLRNDLSAATAAVKALAERIDPDEMIVPYRWEYHADHQAAWEIGNACRSPAVSMYEFPIWYGLWLWNRLAWTARIAAMIHLTDLRRLIRVDISDVAEIKRRAVAAYQSQVDAFRARGPAGKEFLDNFDGRYEWFFTR